MVIRKTEVPIYGSLLHTVVTGDYKKDFPILNKKFKETFVKDEENLGFLETRGSHILIVINVGKHRRIFPTEVRAEIELMATMCHEAVHACNALFRDKGVELDLVNDEPQAYVTDWIMKQIYSTYLKFKENESTI